MTRIRIAVLVVFAIAWMVLCLPSPTTAQPADGAEDHDGTPVPTTTVPDGNPVEKDLVPTATMWTAIAMITGFGALGVWRLRRRISA
ncbi:MAG: hypothetical protein FJZ95_00040 [Chloroflexi bacterium]|nr:hypothetical protein [Chloroflexota bacterium]